MQTKHIAILVIVGLVIGGGAFYGGMQVAKAGTSATQGRFPANMQGQRGQGVPGATGGKNAGGVANGEVLSKDATSLTIKLADGGSKIVLTTSSTTVGKMTNGSMDDVAVGSNVMIMGTANTDGSVTAKTVQLRPSGDAPPKAQ